MSLDRRHIVVGIDDERYAFRSQKLEYFPTASVGQMRIDDRKCRSMCGKPCHRVRAVSANVDVDEPSLAKTVFDFVRYQEVVFQEKDACLIFHGIADRARVTRVSLVNAFLDRAEPQLSARKEFC